MKNLFDVLREIVDAGPGEPVDQAAVDWMRRYLTDQDIMLDLRARPTGDQTLQGDPIYSYHFNVKGTPPEVFYLMVAAMRANPNLASLFIAAGRAYVEHMPFCETCQEYHDPQAAHLKVMDITSWDFKQP